VLGRDHFRRDFFPEKSFDQAGARQARRFRTIKSVCTLPRTDLFDRVAQIARREEEPDARCGCQNDPRRILDGRLPSPDRAGQLATLAGGFISTVLRRYFLCDLIRHLIRQIRPSGQHFQHASFDRHLIPTRAPRQYSPGGNA